MPVKVVVPEVGESITEVEIGDWLRGEGEHVEQDEPLVVIETEKVTVELPAPASGTLVQRLKQKGDKAAVGDVIAYLKEAEEKEEGDGAAPEAARPAAPEIAQPQAPPPAKTPEPATGTAAGPQQATADERRERVVPMTPIRRRIAERLLEAQKNAALLTTFNQADMSAVMALRKEYQEAFQGRYGVKLGLMSFFVKAAIDALRQVPQINAEVRDSDVVYRDYYDIGIAVGGPKGLVVPILRDADRMSFAEIERGIAEFARKVQDNRLKVDELQGGTFTISNGGIYGSLLSTPIVNPPQSGVLGLHAIEDRPVARNGAVVVRPMMYLALTYDHRIVDGREAVTFLRRIRDAVEDPARLLLEI